MTQWMTNLISRKAKKNEPRQPIFKFRNFVFFFPILLILSYIFIISHLYKGLRLIPLPNGGNVDNVYAVEKDISLLSKEAPIPNAAGAHEGKSKFEYVFMENYQDKYLPPRPKVQYIKYAAGMLDLGATEIKLEDKVSTSNYLEAPKYETCENLLSKTKFNLSRDYHQIPIIISGDGNNEMKGCSVRCVFKNPEKVEQVDAVFGKDIIRTMESAVYYPMTSVEAIHGRGVSVAMTPRLDSDVPVGYFSWAEYDFMTQPVSKKTDVIASAVISNCGGTSFRLDAIKGLETHHVLLDKFGNCYGNRFSGTKFDLIRKYPFYLAFENSIENDYVTEKYLQALVTGSIPVVIGAPNIHDFIPFPNSILYIQSIDDVPKVAEIMKKLASNITEYNEMLSWKKNGPWDPFLALVDMAVVHSSCRLCIHFATKNFLKEWNELISNKQELCKCQETGRSLKVNYHKLLVRERGRFDDFETVIVKKAAHEKVTVDDLYVAVLDAFTEKVDFMPIWVGHRKDFRSSSENLKIYKIYPVGLTQRAALYGKEAIDTEEEIESLLLHNCPLLEVIFV